MNTEALPMRIRESRNMNLRGWRVLKRRELKIVKKALDEFRLGCAYTPAHSHVDKMAVIINDALRVCSAKKWGR